MATLKTVYMHGDKLRLNIQLRPDGDVWLDIALPEKFADCIWKIAQAAADKREQEMRAEILADEQALSQDQSGD